jgi:hypothetical protein
VDAPKLKPFPKGRVEQVLVTKQSVAASQLESAIWLWFQEGDPVSVHTLAVAAHDCFRALLRHAGKASDWEDWMKSKSKEFQKKMRVSQNFFKHGHKELKAKLLYPTIQGEMLMMDSVTCYELLHNRPTGLMRLYAQRFLYEHPALITEDALPLFAKNAEIHQLSNSKRREFFEKLHATFVERYDK